METSSDIARRMWEEGYQLQVSGEVEDAIQLYQASISFFPTAEAHTYLGWAYSLKGRFEEAITECKNAIQLDPQFGTPYNHIGLYLIAMNRPDEAVEWLKRASQAQRQDNEAMPYMNLARAYLKLGKTFPALHALRKAFRLNPGYLPAINAYYELLGRLN